MVAILYKML